MRLRYAVLTALTACAVLACAVPGRPAAEASPFGWTIGEWRGARTDGANGRSTPLRLRVTPMLAGAGTFEELTITGASSVYRGAAMQVFEVDKGRWVRQYVNSSRQRFVRLEGEVTNDRPFTCEWCVVDSSSGRRSRLVSERTVDDTWRRTMNVSTDGGETWRVLWSDELRRIATEAR